MAQLVFAEGRGRSDFVGLDSLFEFTNDDGELLRTNCGQAAAATLLTFHNKLSEAAERATEIMAILEKNFPPDQFFGLFGTGKRRVVKICRAHNLELREIRGEESFKQRLRQHEPVLVMLGVPAGKLFKRIDLPGGHWMVAYGYDDDNVYLTNYGSMPWDDFHRGWKALVPRLIAMNHRGLTVDDRHQDRQSTEVDCR